MLKIFDRIIQEELEFKYLSNFALKSHNSKGRKFEEEKHPLRTEFQRDKDRIIHCNAFRKLEYKTQVILTSIGDNYRTRLTHTLEVAQVAATIARILGANIDVVEAISLAHDLGHTPFGHIGEDTLNILLKDFGGFEHNLQSFRIVDEIENRYPDFPGLNLTYEVREGLIKHKSLYDSPLLPKTFENRQTSSIEAQIVNIADEIAYNCHDIEDALSTGTISLDALSKINLWQIVKDVCQKKYNNINLLNREKYIYLIVKELKNYLIFDLIETSKKNIDEYEINSVNDVYSIDKDIICLNPETRQYLIEFAQFLYDNFYTSNKIATMNKNATKILEKVFNYFLADYNKLPFEYRNKIKPNPKQKHRIIADYIVSLSDKSLVEFYEKYVN